MKIKIVIILLFILFAISCNREKNKDKPIVLQQKQKNETVLPEINNNNPPNPAEKPVIESNDSPIELKPSAAAINPVPENQNNKTALPESMINRHYLFYEQNKDIISPEDFEIGPLLVFSTKPETEAQNKVYRDFINRFFNELRKGNIPSSMISQENLFFLTNVFDSYIEKKQIPDNIRIGKAIRNNDTLRLNLRMFKGKNRTEGEIILIELNKSLKIKEFYGDLGILDVEYNKNNEKFEPEIYKF